MASWMALGLFTSAAAHMVNQDAAPVRSSCDSEAQVIAKAAKGEAARILFAISGDIGTCYKVELAPAAGAGGKAIQGYLPAAALSGIESFERGRASAGRIEVSAALREEIVKNSAAAAPGAAPSAEWARIQQLLASSQHEQALEGLEKLIHTGHKNANTLALAGLSALQSDKAKLALEYLDQSLALAPHAGVEELRKRAQREVAGDRSSEKLVGIKFNFRYDEKAVTADQARALLPVLDAEFTRISETLGCRSEERMTAIVQSREDYLRSTGAAEWSGGQFDGRIRVAMLEPTPGEHTRRTFAHEIVHACLARLGDWPGWVHEGLAQKLSGQHISDDRRAQVKQLAQSGTLPPLEQMGPTFLRMSAGNATIAYTTALMAVEQLYGAYGESGVRNLLQNPSSLGRVGRDIDQRLRE